MRVSKALSLLLLLVLSGYVIVRGVVVPITIDEAITFLNYVNKGVWIPGEASVDANNHMLNSLLAILSTNWFGNAPWALRLPNMMAGAVYFLYTLKWSGRMRSWQAALAVFAGLVGSHFLIDFFSVCRGYGLSLAFLLVSLYYLTAWWKKPAIPSLLALLLTSTLAVFSNLSMLVPCTVILGLAAMHVLARVLSGFHRKSILEMAFVALACLPMAYFATVAQNLQDGGFLYVGGNSGFWNETVVSVLIWTFASFTWLRMFAAFALSVSLAVLLLRAFRFRTAIVAHPSFVLAMVLIATVLGQMALHHWLGVNYPTERVALFYLPLSVLAIAQLFDEVSDHAQRGLLHVPLICIWLIPGGAVGQINLDSISQWQWEAGSEQHFEWLQNRAEETGQQPTVAVQKVQLPSFQYYNVVNGGPLWPALGYEQAKTDADFILGEPNMSVAPDGFDSVSVNTTAGTVLFKRQNKRSRTVLLEEFTEEVLSSSEYISFYQGEIEPLIGRGLLFQVRSVLENQGQNINAWIVFEVLDNEGVSKVYTHHDLSNLLTDWHADSTRLEFQFICPSDIENAHFVKLFFWNIEKKPVRLLDVELKILGLNP